MRLNFGVLDIPYQIHVPATLRRVSARPRKNAKPLRTSAAPTGGQTTGDVAEILEDRYHVYQHFWEANHDAIVDAMHDDLRDWFEDRLSGSRANAVSYAAAESTIYTMFQQFIDSRQMDGMGYPGIPTQASLKGVNHRLKHPYAKGNPVRPSFKDTGLYEQSFRVEVEE